MLTTNRKNTGSFIASLCIGLLCLTQTACKTTPSQQKGSSATNKATNDITLNSATEFDLTLKEDTQTKTEKNNYFYLTVTPKDKGMNLNDLNITAAAQDLDKIGKGNVNGKVNKNNSYHSLKKPKSLGALYLEAPSSCLGSEDTKFKNGQEVTFRLQCLPDKSDAPGTQYKLTVTIKGSGYEKAAICDFEKKAGKEN